MRVPANQDAVCRTTKHTPTPTQPATLAGSSSLDTIPYPQPAELWWPDPALPRYPSDVSPTLLLEFEERWIRERATSGDVEAYLKVMLVCAIYRSHDLLLIKWRTGYPADLVVSTLRELQADPAWLDPSGYERLSQDLRRFRLDDNRADRTLGEVLLDLGCSKLVEQ